MEISASVAADMVGRSELAMLMDIGEKSHRGLLAVMKSLTKEPGTHFRADSFNDSSCSKEVGLRLPRAWLILQSQPLCRLDARSTCCDSLRFFPRQGLPKTGLGLQVSCSKLGLAF